MGSLFPNRLEKWYQWCTVNTMKFYSSKWQFRKALRQWWSCPWKRHAGNRRHRHWNLRPQALKTAATSICRNPWQTHICPIFWISQSSFSRFANQTRYHRHFTSNIIIAMIITRVMDMIDHCHWLNSFIHIPSGSNFPIFSNQEGTISFFRWSIPPEMNQGCPKPKKRPIVGSVSESGR